MSSPAPARTLSDNLLLGATRLASLTWPAAGRIFPERAEYDDNQSLWVSQTADYRPGAPLRENITADLAIIGGGFAGVSTAYHFSRRYPEKRVVLLEAKSLANGASGRNGGLMLNWLASMPDHSPEMTRRVYDMTSAGIRMIQAIIERHNLPVSHRSDGTLTVYTDARRAEAAHAEAEYHQQLGIPSQYLDSAALKQHLDLQGVSGGLLDPDTGQINGAQLVRSLRPVLIEQGVAIYEGTPVLSIREGATITLATPHGEVRAQAIALATNGYTMKLGYFRDAIFPLHSHIFATTALTPEQQAALGWRRYAGYSDDLDRIAYSSLTNEGHIVFGGGSNAAYDYCFRNRTVFPGAPESTAGMMRQIKDTMAGYLPGSEDISIAYRWTGTLGFTLNRNPLMGVRGAHQNVYYAIGFCGHGVTLANVAGQVLTDLYSRDDAHWRGLPIYQTGYVPIPPEPFRWIGYQMYTRLTGRSPRL
ncbi:MAG: FAD-dependent oxidoreductase [Anaerolineae bacterium]|nr:FAD-dependent oxidoreductase [Anaerolineae bacterium]